MKRWMWFVTLLLPVWLVAPAIEVPVLPVLAVNSPFALRGQSLNFTVTGAPGASVQLLQTTEPAEVDLGTSGLQFYKSGTQSTLATGTLSPSGTLSQTVPISSSAPVGTTYYVQALTQSGGQTRLSNALAYRIETALPSGARETTAIAATPDGRRAYVGHKRGGIITVVDAVNNTRLAELPVTVGAQGLPSRPIQIAIDPQGRHPFVSNAAADTLTVIHAPSGSVAAQLTVPRGNRGLGFDFRGTPRIYVANEVRNAVLVFEEVQPGNFVARPSIPLQGHAPGPLLVLPDGRIAVGNRTEAEIEILDPRAAPGATTVARTVITGVPYDLAWNGSEILVPSFLPPGPQRELGYNRVLRLDGTGFQVVGALYVDVGTDCRSIVTQPAAGGASPLIASACSGTGTAQIADGASLALLANIDLAPGYPTATPQELAIVRDPFSGLPAKLYITDFFRETVRSIALAGGPPFTLGPELPLAWSGQVRVPLSGALSAVEDGEWFFRSVTLFGGTPMAPNTVTCNSCHMEGAANHIILKGIQVLPPWGSANTAPYGWEGETPTLKRVVRGAMNVHNHTRIPGPDGALDLVMQFVAQLQPPASIYLARNGTPTPDQIAGKALFEGVAQCSACHAAPTFVPPAGAPRTLVDGIGTGLAPINVPSLRAVWATGPYLHDGRAKTLLELLTGNPLDAHGARASALSPAQLDQLVAYLKTL